MDAAFSWVGKIMEFLGRLLPRVLIVEATLSGVAFVRGRNVKLLQPGLHVYWPFWTTVVTTPIVRQTIKLPAQALTTKDGKCVVAGGMVRYKIRNVVKAVAETYDLDGAIADESLVVVCDLVTSQTFNEVQCSRVRFNEKLTSEVHKKLTSYGITVLFAHLTDFSTCTTLNHIGEAFRREEAEE